MEINLLPILNYEGKRINISEDVDISASKDDSFEIKAPIHFDGSAINIGGTIELSGSASASLSFICDRCAERYDATIDYQVDERFKKDDGLNSADEDLDISLLSGVAIDLDELLYTNLILNIPSKSLCREDCKGLCFSCGKNLNHGSCDCDNNKTDPRFDILDKLL